MKSGQYVSKSSTQYENRNNPNAAQARTKSPYAELQDQHAEEARAEVKQQNLGLLVQLGSPGATFPHSTHHLVNTSFSLWTINMSYETQKTNLWLYLHHSILHTGQTCQ